jgi:hypothetical protein
MLTFSSNLIVAASQVNIIMQSTTRIGIEPILDEAIKNVTERTAIKTVSMLPDGTNNRAYRPGENRDRTAAIVIDENEGEEDGDEEENDEEEGDEEEGNEEEGDEEEGDEEEGDEEEGDEEEGDEQEGDEQEGDGNDES